MKRVDETFYVFCYSYITIKLALYMKLKGYSVIVITNNYDLRRFCYHEDIDVIYYPKLKNLKNFLKVKQTVDDILGAICFPCNIIYQGIFKTIECNIIIKKISMRKDGSRVFFKDASSISYHNHSGFGFWKLYHLLVYRLLFGIWLHFYSLNESLIIGCRSDFVWYSYSIPLYPRVCYSDIERVANHNYQLKSIGDPVKDILYKEFCNDDVFSVDKVSERRLCV